MFQMFPVSMHFSFLTAIELTCLIESISTNNPRIEWKKIKNGVPSYVYFQNKIAGKGNQSSSFGRTWQWMRASISHCDVLFSSKGTWSTGHSSESRPTFWSSTPRAQTLQSTAVRWQPSMINETLTRYLLVWQLEVQLHILTKSSELHSVSVETVWGLVVSTTLVICMLPVTCNGHTWMCIFRWHFVFWMYFKRICMTFLYSLSFSCE